MAPTNKIFPSCDFNNSAGDVYYSILVPNNYSLTIGQTDNDYDSVVTVFFGDCDNQMELTCFDDDDLTVFNYTNTTELIRLFFGFRTDLAMEQVHSH